MSTNDRAARFRRIRTTVTIALALAAVIFGIDRIVLAWNLPEYTATDALGHLALIWSLLAVAWVALMAAFAARERR